MHIDKLNPFWASAWSHGIYIKYLCNERINSRCRDLIKRYKGNTVNIPIHEMKFALGELDVPNQIIIDAWREIYRNVIPLGVEFWEITDLQDEKDLKKEDELFKSFETNPGIYSECQRLFDDYNNRTDILVQNMPISLKIMAFKAYDIDKGIVHRAWNRVTEYFFNLYELEVKPKRHGK